MRSAEPAVTATEASLREMARARFRASSEVPAAFFRRNAAGIALACRDLARTFDRGGRLLVFGEGERWSDAVHVSVEFVHPVIVGKRALPAIALAGDPLAHLRALGEAGDVALVFAGGDPERAGAAVAAAREGGLGTIALTGGDAPQWFADHTFAVDCDDPAVVQETHETLYHVLWELVHVFLDHPGTLR